MTEGRVTLREGDCRDVMLDLILEGVQVDAIVTDPPYHLSTVKRFGKPGSAPARSNGPSGVYKRAAAGFMGKAWDGGDIAFDPETWGLCLNLLRPGGHLLAFSGARTYHRMACAIEDAGFEIRDQIGWAYGSGFPKSHDVSKAIDKVGGVAPDYRDIAEHIRAVRKASGVSAAEMASWFPYKSVTRNWERTDQGQRIPSAQDYAVLVDRIGASPQMEARRAQAEREVVGRSRNGIAGGSGFHAGEAGVYGFRAEYDLTVPATEAARQWEGWGTALKPAWEPIVVARKPLSEKSVAANVLKHRTGALNIDGCRIPTTENLGGGAYAKVGGRTESPSLRAGSGMNVPGKTAGKEFEQPPGRWPANLIHDGSDEVLALFPDSGGSAARFFYCPKASKKDRAGSSHPTVKPIDLMRYLCRLVTPPGGTVLDPFAGSGTTGQAAVEEGFKTILIEREAEYIADIRRRLGLPASDTFADGIFA